MNCEREIEIVEALMDGRWPDGCEPSLVAHTKACASCAEVVTIAGALRAEHRRAMQEASFPPSGVVWWRAQRRLRAEALAKAARAITTMQAAAVAIGATAALTILGVTAESWGTWLGQFTDRIHFGTLEFAPAASVVLLAGAASALLLAPIAVWFALAED